MVTVEVLLVSRPKNRPVQWACRVSDGQNVIFDSKWVSLRLHSQDAAKWLADLVVATSNQGAFWPPPGHRANDRSLAAWDGDLNDDCVSSLGDLCAHAEWCKGPRHGGVWFCMVSSRDLDSRYFHDLDIGVQPSTGTAARWLCELVMSAANSGILAPYLVERPTPPAR
jgi:hypothetical protein